MQDIFLNDGSVYWGEQVFRWSNENGDFAIFWTPWSDNDGNEIFKYVVAYSIPALGKPSHRIEETVRDLHQIVAEIESFLMRGTSKGERNFPFTFEQMQDEIQYRVSSNLWINPMQIPPYSHQEPELAIINKVVVV